MIKSILAITALALAAVAVSASTTSINSEASFSSPAAQVSWQTNANMTADASEVASASAKSILGVQSQGYGRPTGTYNCTNDCSRSCTNTCSTNFRCR